MNIKTLFLLAVAVFLFPSCSLSKQNLKIYPPFENYTKVFKDATITKCYKKTKKCEQKKAYSTGSGLIVDIVKGETTVLSAGHVCSSEFEDVSNDEVSITFTETIFVMNSEGTFHQAHVILSEQKSYDKETADLCLLFIPTIEYSKIRKKIIISNKPAQIGEELYYMGSPWGVYHPPTVPIFKGIFSGPISEISSMATLPVAPGSSGGVVLNFKNKIVGVVYAVHPNMNQVSMITSYNSTKDFLIRAKKLFKK